MNRLSEFQNTIKNLDYALIASVLAAVTIGIVFITSASQSLENPSRYPIVQGVAFALGFILMLIVVFLDYEYIASHYVLIGAVCVALLILVAIIGVEENGAKRWFYVGPVNVQPSELVKLGFIITFAKHVDMCGDKLNKPLNVLALLAHGAVPAIAIMMQPDMGTALVFVFIFVVMMIFSDVSVLYLMAGAIGSIFTALCAWLFLMHDYQKRRVYTFINKDLASDKDKWHIEQSLISIGSGQVMGKGLFNGSQVQSGMLYGAHNDFIFAAIGEEGGLIWCSIVILLLFSIIAQGINTAYNAKNKLGRLISMGIAAMWLIHSFENIGMTMGIMPISGIPLPFISYGGTSILSNMIAVGLLLSVRLRPRTINF